jgi:hypothetical protein
MYEMVQVNDRNQMVESCHRQAGKALISIMADSQVWASNCSWFIVPGIWFFAIGKKLRSGHAPEKMFLNFHRNSIEGDSL